MQASDGREALDLVGGGQADLVLLDLGLPDIGGMEVWGQMRLYTRCPIIVVSGESSETRLIEALDLGADDFVTKPFSAPTLLARMRVALRHAFASAAGEDDLIEVGPLRIDVGAYEATVGHRPLGLNAREFKL